MIASCLPPASSHLLHIKGAGGFTTLIVPRPKGMEALAVTQEGEAKPWSVVLKKGQP